MVWVCASVQASVTAQYAELIPQLASMARSLVRDLDPQNDLQFLRIRSQMHEIMGASPARQSADVPVFLFLIT